MSAQKTPINKSSLDDFKTEKHIGITNSRYIVRMSIPKTWIKNPEESTGISASFIQKEELRNLAFYAAGNSIEKVYKNTITLAFEISEPYLEKFHKASRFLPDEAELKINSKG
jgi:hypothetical protein